MTSTHVLFETTKYELHTPSADGCTRNRYFYSGRRSPVVTVFYCISYKESSAENIDFWFTHLQMDYEAHIWWFWRVHEYSSSTEYEGLTPTRNRFIDDLIFCPTMVFSYNEMMLGFHRLISLEIRSDIIKMEKYSDLGFSMRCSRPQDPSDLQLSSPNSPCNYPNDVDTSLLFFCIFLSNPRFYEHALLDLVI